MRILLTYVLAIAIFAPTAGAARSQDVEREPSIHDLDILVGTWRFVDQSTENSDLVDYTDAGMRVCEYVLQNTYIRCHSISRQGENNRESLVFINYNPLIREFEWVGMFGDFPGQWRMTGRVSEHGRQIDFVSERQLRSNGLYSQSWNSIRFTDNDNYIWQIHVNRSDEPQDAWPVRFVDRGTRVLENEN